MITAELAESAENSYFMLAVDPRHIHRNLCNLRNLWINSGNIFNDSRHKTKKVS